MSPLTGGCACGAIRYEIDTEPVFSAHCHCTDCQRAGGGQMSTVAAVPRAALRVTRGTTRSFAYTGDSGQPVLRHFCPDCGARLYTDVQVMPDMLFLAAGSMDDASGLKPDMHIYTRSKQPWAHIAPDAQCFEGMPG